MTDVKINKLLPDLVKASTKSRKAITLLKNLTVVTQQYELASELRALELEYFPETPEIKAQREEAKRFVQILSLVDISISEKNAWVVLKAKTKLDELGISFCLDDGVKILLERDNIYHGLE